MADVDDRIAALKRQREEAVERKARADSQVDMLQGQLQGTMNTLKEQYEVASLEEAEELLATYETSIATMLGQVEQTIRSAQ
jgi:hypothetical protein